MIRLIQFSLRKEITHKLNMQQNMSFSSLRDRIDSFSKDWPHCKSGSYLANPLTLAGAGFYSDPRPGSLDRTVCFSCGLALMEWEPHDDPVTQHKESGKECAYVRELDTLGVENIVDLFGKYIAQRLSSVPEHVLEDLLGFDVDFALRNSKKRAMDSKKGAVTEDKGKIKKKKKEEDQQPRRLFEQAKRKQMLDRENLRQKMIKENAEIRGVDALTAAKYKTLFAHDIVMSTLLKSQQKYLHK
jgi:hypothetical protein